MATIWLPEFQCNAMQRVPKPAVVFGHNAFMPDSNYGLTGQPTGNAVRTAEQLAERTDLLLAKAEVLAHGIGDPRRDLSDS